MDMILEKLASGHPFEDVIKGYPKIRKEGSSEFWGQLKKTLRHLNDQKT